MRRLRSCRRWRRRSGDKGLRLELGTAYYKKSDFPNAIEYLKKASGRRPANREAVQLLGMSYYRRRTSGRCDSVAGKGARMDSASQRRWLLHSRDLLHPDPKLRSGAKGVRKDVQCPRGFCGGISIYRAHAAAAGIRSGGRRVCAEGRRRSIPNCRWRIISWENFTCTSRACPNAIAEFQKELAINPAHAADVLQTCGCCIRACRSTRRRKRMLQRSIRLDSTSSVPFILMGKVLRRRATTIWRCCH